MLPDFRPPVPPSEFAAIRFRLLAEGLGDLYGRPKYGWKAKVARRMGVDPSYLTRVLSGDRASIGVDMIETVVQTVPIRRTYFAPSALPGERPEQVDWRAYVVTPGSPEAETRDALVDGAKAFHQASRIAKSWAQSEPKSAEKVRQLAREVINSSRTIQAAFDVLNATSDEQAIDRGWMLAARLLADGVLSADELGHEREPISLELERVTPKRLRVRARGTGLLPWPGAPGRFVGYRKATASDPESQVYRVGDAAFVNVGAIDVPDSPYFQRALARGDIEKA